MCHIRKDIPFGSFSSYISNQSGLKTWKLRNKKPVNPECLHSSPQRPHQNLTSFLKQDQPSCCPDSISRKYTVALISAGARFGRMQDLVPWQDLYCWRRIKAECEWKTAIHSLIWIMHWSMATTDRCTGRWSDWEKLEMMEQNFLATRACWVTHALCCHDQFDYGIIIP